MDNKVLMAMLILFIRYTGLSFLTVIVFFLYWVA